MSAHVKILKGDLHLAVSTAFNRGRYVLMTGGGDGQPIEITIDLRERPDDLFEQEGRDWVAESSPGRLNAGPRREDIGKWRPFSTDDHGPAIPAQAPVHVGLDLSKGRDITVYEFAVGDITRGPLHLSLSTVELEDAPDQAAVAAADYVHVYDRVTRERRTLKRPEPDAVLTGLRDVAADLRGKCSECDGTGLVEGLDFVGGSTFETCPKCGGKKRGAPVEPPFGCAPLPPVGPDEV